MTYAELIALLRDLRIKQGLSQAEIARRRGVTPGTQNHHENGVRTADLDSLQGWADSLGAGLILTQGDERELVEAFRELDEAQQQAVRAVLSSMRPKKS